MFLNIAEEALFPGVGFHVARSLRLAIRFLLVFTAKINLKSSEIGTTRFYQIWFRDPIDPFGVGTSDALEVRICE